MAEHLLIGIAAVLLTLANADYDVKEYCELTQPGVKLPSFDSCESYYTCMGKLKLAKSSCYSNNVFEKNAQACVAQGESNCYYGLANPCVNKSNEFAYSTRGCNWYNYCVNGKIEAEGTCLMGQKFYAANSTCIFGSCGSGSKSNTPDICEIMPEGVFFGDFENCRAWHRCVAMNKQSGLCDGNLVFDVVSGFCLENEDGMCRRTKNMVAGTAGGPPEEACTNVTQVVGDTRMCSVYYTCVEATQGPTNTYQWLAKSCKNQYFDVISKTCSGPTTARTLPGCNRCELKNGYLRTYWVNDVDPNCAKYLTCSGGQMLGKSSRSCSEGAYYDEDAQACIESAENSKEYAARNGVCQDYTCNESRECELVSSSEKEGGEKEGEQKEDIPQPPSPDSPKEIKTDDNKNTDQKDKPENIKPESNKNPA